MEFRRKIATGLLLGIASSFALSGVAHGANISGSGATFPKTFLDACIPLFNQKSGHTLSYNAKGSGGGKRDFRGNLVDFAGTDSLVSASENPSFGWTYVPYVLGGIGVVYRLDELKGADLSLSASTVGGIFSGKITNWNDPAIAKDVKAHPVFANSVKKSAIKGAVTTMDSLSATKGIVSVNMTAAAAKSSKGKKVDVIQDVKGKKTVLASAATKIGAVNIDVKLTKGAKYMVEIGGKKLATFTPANIKLPNKKITVVYRSDTSGTTNNFVNYLRNTDTANAWTTNDAFTASFPGGATSVPGSFQGQSGSTALSNYVADNNGTISYTEVSFVIERESKGMKAAYVKNAAGRYVYPTSANVTAFLSDYTPGAKGTVAFNYRNRDASAYPITAVTYLLGKTAVSENNGIVSAFAQFLIDECGPQLAESLYYAPVTGALLKQAQANAKTINAG
jgi:phosphate transport system substrate-binding protein